MAFYVLDENNNKVEAFDKEGVLSLLEQAIQEGTLQNILADSGFISKIKCCVSGITNKIAFVSQTTYNQLKADELLIPNAWYFITDDTTAEDINEQLELLNNWFSELSSRVVSLENNFTNGVANKARITNLTNSAVETKQVLLVDTRNEEIGDVVQMWVELDEVIYNLGLVRLPSKPNVLMGNKPTKAFSSPLVFSAPITDRGNIDISNQYTDKTCHDEMFIANVEITCIGYQDEDDFGRPFVYYIYDFVLVESYCEAREYLENAGDFVEHATIILNEKEPSERTYKIYWRNIQ